MIEFLNDQRNRVESELKELYIQRPKSGISTEGEYDIKIERLKRELVKINNDIELHKEAQTPENHHINCFVLCANKQEIKAHLSELLYQYLDEDRYDDSEISKWKPFALETTIGEILDEFKKSRGYNFDTVYMNGEVPVEVCVLLDENKINSFAIIDLLSITSLNALTIQRLDTKDLKGLFMPYCKRLHSDLREFMDLSRAKYFKNLEYYSQSIPNSLYVYDISAKQSFFQQLTQLFYINFKIKNNIQITSQVRAIDFSMR